MRIEVHILDFAMLKEARQPNPIVCQMPLLSDNDDIVLSALGVHLEEFFSADIGCQLLAITKS